MLTSMQRPSGITWLVAPGLAMIAVTYGLARFAYGLFLPEMRESLDLSESVLGLIGAGSYAGYCLAVFAALALTSRSGPRLMAVAAGSVAVVGMAAVAGAPTGWVLALGVLFAFYHLYQPWSIPAALADIVLTAYPTRRWQSVWMSIIVHSAQSVFIIVVILGLVLG